MDNPIYNGALLLTTFLFALLQFYTFEATGLTFVLLYFVPTVLLSFVFLVDMVVNFWKRGFKNVRDNRPILFFEVFLTTFYWISFTRATVVNEDYNPIAKYSHTNTIFWMRLLRCFEFMQELHDYKLLVVTSKNLTKPFMYKALLLYIVFFFYACIGQKLWGGMINKDIVSSTGAAPDYYYLMNFNSYNTSMATLFALMMVNNWFVTINMIATLSGNSVYPRLFFTTFWILVVLILLNVVLAMILEVYSSVEQEVIERSERTKLIIELKKIIDRHVVYKYVEKGQQQFNEIHEKLIEIY